MAPQILQGEFVDAVGGGVSQFATTFYNAIFFGCYEIVEHTPHSFYFSRYPEGREATISWPSPDVVFRNDSDALILIKSYASDNQCLVSPSTATTVARTAVRSRSDRRDPDRVHHGVRGGSHAEPDREVLDTYGSDGLDRRRDPHHHPPGRRIGERDLDPHLSADPHHHPGPPVQHAGERPEECPVQVPTVSSGLTFSEAQARLADAGSDDRRRGHGRRWTARVRTAWCRPRASPPGSTSPGGRR